MSQWNYVQQLVEVKHFDSEHISQLNVHDLGVEPSGPPCMR